MTKRIEQLNHFSNAIRNQVDNTKRYLDILNTQNNTQFISVKKEEVIDSLSRLMLDYNKTISEVLSGTYNVLLLPDSLLHEDMDLEGLDADYEEGDEDDDSEDIDYEVG